MTGVSGAVSRCPFAHHMRGASTKAMDVKVEIREAVDHAEERCPFLKNNEGVLTPGARGITSNVAPGPLRTLARQCPVMSTAIRDVTGTASQRARGGGSGEAPIYAPTEPLRMRP